jgi:hypothetical protein
MTRVIFFKKAFSRLWGTCPATRALPLVGWTRPVSIFRVVVLPAPLGPKNPHHLPGLNPEGNPLHRLHGLVAAAEKVAQGAEKAFLLQGHPVVPGQVFRQDDGACARHAPKSTLEGCAT